MNHLFSVNLAAFFEERQQEVIRDPTTGQQTGVYIPDDKARSIWIFFY